MRGNFHPPFFIVCENQMTIITETILCLNLIASLVFLVQKIREQKVISEKLKEQEYQQNLVQIGGLADVYSLEDE